MTDAILVGDVHMSDKAPSGRQNTYAIEIIEKIIWVSDKAIELGVPLVFAGDIFHLKAPSKNSHMLVQAVHEALQGVPTWIVPGNHDLQHDRLDTLDKQPLGALSRMKNVRLLMGEDFDLSGIVGVPYITEFDGGDWQTALDTQWDWFHIHSADLIVTHAPIFPPGQEPGVYASIAAKDWAQYWKWTKANVSYYGHIHDCHGTFEVDGHTFCNQGALSRGSLHESSIQRKPAVTLWSGGEFTRIEVPHKTADEVFLFEKAEQVANNKASAVEFAQALGQTQLTSLTFNGILDTLKSTVQDKQVLRIIEEVLEEVQ